MSSIAFHAAQKPQITLLEHGEQNLAFYHWPQAPEVGQAAVLLLHGLRLRRQLSMLFAQRE